MTTALATIAAITSAFALRRGMSLEDIERCAGLTGRELADPHARVPDRAIAGLWRALSESEPDDALTIELVRSAPLAVLGGLAHGALFAASVEEALRLLVENRSVLAERVHISLERSGDLVAVEMSHPLDDLDGGRMNEIGLGLIWRFVREVAAGPVDLIGVEFSRAPQGPKSTYQEFFNRSVEFNGRRNALVFEAEALQTRTSQASLDLFAFVLEYFQDLRARIERRSASDELGRLQRAVADCAVRGEFDTQSVAASAGVSLRTAQRIAAARGTSLTELIRSKRIEIARELLQDGRLSIEAVAELVGYAEERSFRRAYEGWTGQTPARFRRNMRGMI
ncbi:MAG: AraC family transcriptional regulator ligand-binding domain-containing protein [Planctomycetota bacterium]